MLQASLAAGTAERRSVFEVFTRRLPEGGATASSRAPGGFSTPSRTSASTPTSSASCARTPSWTSRPWSGSPRTAFTGTSGAIPRARCTSRARRSCGSRVLRGVRAPGDRDPLHPQPRLGHRGRRLPDGLRRRGPAADRDGRPADARAGRGGGGAGRVRRGLHDHLRPGRGLPLRHPDRRHLRTRLHPPARPGAGRLPGPGELAGPGTTLLVDTYDVAEAVRMAVEVAGPELGAVRIDSGDLLLVAHRVRQQLDELGARTRASS